MLLCQTCFDFCTYMENHEMHVFTYVVSAIDLHVDYHISFYQGKNIMILKYLDILLNMGILKVQSNNSSL